METTGVPAIITAGDLRASRAIGGQSKVYLELAGLPLVAHVVATLQDVPEVSEVWVVGDAERLEQALSDESFRAGLSKPLRIQSQFRSLYENAWETYRRALPGAPEAGIDPVGADLDRMALFLSADLPFVTAQELSAFIRRSLSTGKDYLLGLVPESSLTPFYPRDSKPGIAPAFFNIRDGRLRQSNLHLARPGRMGKRQHIEDMYEHRHQREWADMLGLAWRLLVSERAGLQVVYFFMLLHLAGLADRWRLRGLADRLRSPITLARVEGIISRLLDTRFGFVLTEVGGSAIDVDTEAEYDAVRERFEEWRAVQAERAEQLYGPVRPDENTGAT